MVLPVALKTPGAGTAAGAAASDSAGVALATGAVISTAVRVSRASDIWLATVRFQIMS